MAEDEKFQNTTDKLVGKAKELEGRLTGDKEREVEEKTQSLKGQAKDDVQKVRDTVHDAVDAAKGFVKGIKGDSDDTDAQ
ncbi:CsbD family protein [Leuconostoc pseudomesenteroides]|uniref:CsbD family protein n=1 Tax=Leuconostoc pseudomesenteroides TaxID=33968 RepID=UPI0039E775E4